MGGINHSFSTNLLLLHGRAASFASVGLPHLLREAPYAINLSTKGLAFRQGSLVLAEVQAFCEAKILLRAGAVAAARGWEKEQSCWMHACALCRALASLVP